jgi:hypothetical protein
MLTRDILKRYLLEMPGGHIFDLTYKLFADVFPPGQSDVAARQKLRALAEECGCDVVDNRFELTRR